MDHKNHFQANTSGSILSTKNLIICFGLVVAAIAAVKVLNLPVSTVLLVAVLLACPLLHIWMMNNGHKH